MPCCGSVPSICAAAVTWTTAQCPLISRCSRLKYWAAFCTAGAMSLDTATLASTGCSAQSELAMIAWVLSTAISPAAITIASATSREVVRPRRIPPRPARPACPVLTADLTSLHPRRGARSGPRAARLYRTLSPRTARLTWLTRRPAGPVLTGARRCQTGRVPPVLTITDPADPRLADFTGLTDVRRRRSLEAEHGLFIAEGEKVIRRAVAAGYPVRSLLVPQDRQAALADLIAACPGPVHVIPPDAAAALTGYQVHRGALASMLRRPLPPPAQVLAAARRVVVCEDIVDHGNLGGIFRCAAALGMDAVILAPRCADPLYRRAVKVSMG